MKIELHRPVRGNGRSPVIDHLRRRMSASPMFITAGGMVQGIGGIAARSRATVGPRFVPAACH